MQIPLEHPNWTQIQSLSSIRSRPNSNLSPNTTCAFLSRAIPDWTSSWEFTRLRLPENPPEPRHPKILKAGAAGMCWHYIRGEMPPLCGCIPSRHKIAEIWRESWRNLKIYWKRFLAEVSKFLSGGKGNQRLLTPLTIEVQLKFFTCLEHWGSFCHICCRKQFLRSYYFWAHCIELHEQPFWNLNCLGQSSGPWQCPWVQIFQLLLSGRLSDGWGLCFPQRGEMKL